MSGGYQGNGTFQFTYSWAQDAANGIAITASRMDQEFADATSGFNNVICRDGQSTISANIPWGGYRLTGLGAPTTAGDALSYGNAASVSTLTASGALTYGGVTLSNGVTGTGLMVLSSSATLSGACTLSGTLALPDGGNINGSGIASLGTVSGAYFTAVGAGGGTFTASGFGVTNIFSIGGLSQTSGSGITMEAGGSGGVILNNNATAWSAVSDYRAKDVFGLYTDSGAIIDAVPVYLASYKDSHVSRPMFLAHEVANGGAPFAVHGEKDAVDDEGNAVMQTLDSTDPLVAVLWAEVRDLRRRLETAGI